MAGLVELRGAAEKVTIRETEIDVYGVSAEGAAELLSRFPELRKAFAGRGLELTQEKLFSLGGKVITAILAAGTGKAGDKATEEVARTLSISEQVDLMEPILRLSFPKGFAPFFEQITKLGALLNLDVTVGPQATKSPKRSSN